MAVHQIFPNRYNKQLAQRIYFAEADHTKLIRDHSSQYHNPLWHYLADQDQLIKYVFLLPQARQQDSR